MNDTDKFLRRFSLAIFFFALYAANVLATKVQIAMGNISPVRINDVGEFLLLFAASIAFVMASLKAEKNSIRK
ncbi:MAG: hypothetical protein HWE34_15515 [Methylocystaceae bacterium]|nr:hypothetical protein [Methylocystaceae bacterium]